MALFSSTEDAFVRTLGQLIECNPFLPRRVELERAALGSQFVGRDANWNLDPTIYRRSENVILIAAKATALIESQRNQFDHAEKWSHTDQTLYGDLVDYVMFSELVEPFATMLEGDWSTAPKLYAAFCDRLAAVQPNCLKALGNRSPNHLFAIYFQLYRAFRHVFDHLIGSSNPIIKLRAEVWQSIFSHDVRRYRERLYNRMQDFSTLVTGPSGSGKELVARAIGLSCYVPYLSESNRFAYTLDDLFHPVNLSALSPTLIESELFGHKRGAYTGATADRQGWLEGCRPYGSVFLDEIGELSVGIQVKLLRVLQERAFQRLGDTTALSFEGRIIAATNRNLAELIHEGRFRSDFYYRICSDQIQMPSLAERCLADSNELQHLVSHLLRRILSEESPDLIGNVLGWIDATLGTQYDWPGNVRELEQCIRSWLIRKHYRPVASSNSQPDALRALLRTSSLTAEELVAIYCASQYEVLGSYQAVGKLLQLDRRTVKARVEQANSASRKH